MLTDAERRTYHFIKHFFKLHAKSPTLPEIAEGIGITSRGVVHRYIQSLLAEGLINVTPRRHRGIELINDIPSHKRIALPLEGLISAGQPIEAIANNEVFDFSEILDKPDLFILKVQGNSMINDGILNNDLVICQHCDVAENGKIVVALIDNCEVTLKRFQRNIDDSITLIPANSSLSPMVYHSSRVQIQGVFIGLIRLSN